jgi:murein DD-endopeptidase MepM/ murein hydrolase activator NlpD
MHGVQAVRAVMVATLIVACVARAGVVPAPGRAAPLEVSVVTPGRAATLEVNASAPGGAATLEVSASTVVQGQTVRVRLTATPSLPPTLESGGRRVPMFVHRGGYEAFLGTSPLTPPGRLTLRVSLHRDGRLVVLTRTVRVRPGTFGIRRLRVPPRLLDPELVALERRKILRATAHPLPAPQWDGPFRLPVDGPVTSNYGVRSIYNDVPAGYHLGVDFRADEGTPVVAAQRGLVTLAELLPLGGQTVVIDHGVGIFTTYLHLSAIEVRAGQPVRAGDRIGRVGSTGLSTGPHLHWGLRVHGVLVDPLEWTTGVLARR